MSEFQKPEPSHEHATELETRAAVIELSSATEEFLAAAKEFTAGDTHQVIGYLKHKDERGGGYYSETTDRDGVLTREINIKAGLYDVTLSAKTNPGQPFTAHYTYDAESFSERDIETWSSDDDTTRLTHAKGRSQSPADEEVGPGSLDNIQRLTDDILENIDTTWSFRGTTRAKVREEAEKARQKDQSGKGRIRKALFRSARTNPK